MISLRMNRERGHVLDVGKQPLQLHLANEVKDPNVGLRCDEKDRLRGVEENTLHLALYPTEHSSRGSSCDLVDRHRGAFSVRADGSNVVSLRMPCDVLHTRLVQDARTHT